MRRLVLLLLFLSSVMGLEMSVQARPTAKLTYLEYLTKVKGFLNA